jgi:peptidoglycan/LPS O-acetylase OafA/YrhL
MGTQKRYYVLDGMRGIAAVMVMIYHLTHHNSLLTWHIAQSQVTFLTSTSLAVDFFFMLSGFVIAHSYGKRLLKDITVSDYLLRRFIRLYPMFLLGIILGTPVLYFLAQAGESDFSARGIIASFIYNAAGLPSLHGFSSAGLGADEFTKGQLFPSNPPAWSLFFEMVASIAFIVLCKLRVRKLLTIASVSFLAFIAMGFLSAFLSYNWRVDFGIGWTVDNFWGGVPRVLFGFTVGIILYHVSRHKLLAKKLCWIDIRNPYALYFLLILILAFPTGLKGVYPLMILMVLAPITILLGANATCTHAADIRIAEFLGWLSYPVYCLHMPICRAVWLIGEKLHASPADMMYVSVATTLLISILLTRLVEEPVRALLTSRLLRRAQLSAQPTTAGAGAGAPGG